MTYRLHRDAAWVVDENGDTIYTVRMPHGTPMVLQGVAALLFDDLANGRDPIAEAEQRWPEGGAEVGAASQRFLDDLVQAGVAVRVPRARRALQDDAAPTTTTDPTEAATPATAATTSSGPFRVLWVCTANICRSAYADVLSQAQHVPGVAFASAGTHALVGHEIDPPMARQLPENVNPADHRAQSLTGDLMAEADLVVAMSERHRAYILDEWPQHARKTFIIGHVAREMARMPGHVGLDGLVDHLWAHRTAEPGDSVRDPYGRGETAAQQCARTIDAHLHVILERISRAAKGER